MNKHFRYSILALCALFLTSNLYTSAQIKPKNQNAMDQWVQKQMKQLTIKEKIAQMIMPIIYPTANLSETEAMVKSNQWGGILYQKGLLADQKRMNDRLQEVAKIPLLITLDGEWGLYMRLKDAPRYPRNLGLGYANNPKLMYEYGQEVARQCRIMGIHVNFAPSLDVNNNPDNPVIGTRSFGSSVQTVIDNGLSYAQGLEDGGVLSVSKHFPGHGNTDKDSHKTLPQISSTLQQLKEVELKPFQAYIDQGFGGVMVAHLNVPALDNGSEPSSISKKIVTKLLREEMGFGGLIFTDAMEMAGAKYRGKYPVGVMAVLAGQDILLGPQNPVATLNDIVKAYEDGIVTEAMINEHCERILRYKYMLIIDQNNPKVSLAQVKNAICTPQAKEFEDRLWMSSMNMRKDDGQLRKKLANNGFKKVGILSVGGTNNSSFVDELTKRITCTRIPAEPKAAKEKAAWEKRLQNYDLIIVNLFAYNNTASTILNKLQGRNTIVISFMSPFAIKNMQNILNKTNVYIDAVEACSEAQRAAAKTLLNASETTYNVQDLVGFGTAKKKTPQLDSELDAIAMEGLKSGAYPGCQVLVMKDGKVLYDKCFGTMTGKGVDNIVTQNTYYDLASMTKACATTPMIMQLVADGKLKLNGTIDEYLPFFKGTEVGKITVKQLLLHEGGLPPTINFYTDLIDPTSYSDNLIKFKPSPGYVSIGPRAWGDPNFRFLTEYVSAKKDDKYCMEMAKGIYLNKQFKDKMMERIAATPIRNKGRYKYSDVSFILLQQVGEQVAGMPIEEYTERFIFKPIGAKLFFHPLEHQVALSDIAPTQEDKFLRKQTIRGTVDDETAACLGGGAGNAGLYGNIKELAKLMMLFTNKGNWNGKQIINKNTFNLFTQATGYKAIRNLGFDKPRLVGNSSAARSASLRTYGHTGFTGTCFWIDPAHNLAFVFLSNRTYPSRTNTKLMTMNIRPRLHQAIYDTLVN